jgi:propanol-preferring alcohol dehydrogenase
MNPQHSGVCHSDLSVMINGWKTLPFPTAAGQVGGHEGIGIVQQLGTENETSPVKAGDRVGVKWAVAACGSCPQCRNGFDGHCSKIRKISGLVCLPIVIPGS